MRPLAPEQERRVLDSAMGLFATHPLHDITLDRLTDGCGVPAFDIVRHYHSKENILTAVLERELELIASAVHAPELRLPGETLRDELQALARIILQEYRNRLPFLAKLLAEAMRDPQVGALFYRTFIVQGRLLFSEFLNIRMALGELREDVDVEAAAAIFLSALTGILLLVEVFGGRNVETLDDERLAREMADVFLHGVAKKCS